MPIATLSPAECLEQQERTRREPRAKRKGHEQVKSVSVIGAQQNSYQPSTCSPNESTTTLDLTHVLVMWHWALCDTVGLISLLAYF